MMTSLSYVCGNGQHEHFPGVFVFRLAFFLAFWNFGMTGIVVYDGNIDVEDFPDVELSYTRPIKRNGIEGPIVAATPIHACINISKPPDMNVSLNWFVLISGNSCSFETKVLNAKLAGYSTALIYTYRGRLESPSSSHNGHHHFYSNMSAVVIKTEHGIRIKDYYLYTVDKRFRIFIFPNNSFSIMTFLLLFSIVAGLFLVIMLAFAVIRFFQQSQSVNNGRLSSRHLRQLQTSVFQKGDRYETCAICLEDFKDHDKLRILPCSHAYHTKCIDPWLTNNRRICPVCKQKVVLAGEVSNNMDSDSDERSETTPLLQTRGVDTHGTFNPASVSGLNLNCNNLSTGSSVGENAHLVSNVDTTPEREHDRHYVLTCLQL